MGFSVAGCKVCLKYVLSFISDFGTSITFFVYDANNWCFDKGGDKRVGWDWDSCLLFPY